MKIPEASGESAQPRKEKRGTWWGIPLVTAAVLALVMVAVYLTYVPPRREYLANRNFRVLAVLGDQVQEMVSIYGSILEFAADLAEPARNPKRRRKEDFNEFLVLRPEDKNLNQVDRNRETRRDYLKFLAPDFELIEIAAPNAGKPPGAESRMDVKRRNGSWELTLTAEGHAGSRQTYMGSLGLDVMLKPLTASLPFDDLLLVSEKGTIVYQRNRSGPQFTTLASLLEAETPTAAKTAPATQASQESGNGDDAPEKSPSVNQNSDPRWKHRSMHLTEVTLAGTRYKLFLQPVLVDVYSDEPGENEPAREWVLCGLKSAKELEWEALSINSTLVIWFTAIFLIICMGGPLLKILLMNHRERLRFADLGALAFFMVLLTSVITFTCLQAAGFPLNDDTEKRLEELGKKLSGNIHDEMRDMRDQLVAWCGTPEIRHDLADAATREVIRKAPQNTEQARGRHAGDTPTPTIYPNLINAFWTDDDGQQIVKWSSGGYLTPLIDVSREDIYKHPKTVYLDSKGPAFYFGSVVPPNKLEYLSVLTMKTADCNPGLASPKIAEDISGGSVSLTAQALSLINPILPFGYGFAVLDDQGRVVFHGDKTRNLHENFWQETDWNREIYSASFGHSAPRSIPVKYMGTDYRARVSPIAGLSQAPWSLVVYRDLTTIRTLNLQAMTMATTLLLAILSAPVLIFGLWCWAQRMRFAPEWLWPNQARLGTYLSLIVVYSLLILVILAAGFTGPVEENIVACFVVPYTALLLTIWCFRAHPTSALTREARRTGRNLSKMLWLPAALGVVAALSFFLLGPIRIQTFSGWPLLVGLALIGAMPFLERPVRYLFLRITRASRSLASVGARIAAREKPERTAWRKCYVLSVLLLLALIGILTPIALFRACLNVERRLSVKQNQLHLAAALNDRLLKIGAACDTGELGQAACDTFRAKPSARTKQPAFNTGPAWGKAVLDPLFPEDGSLPVVPHVNSTAASDFYSGWLERLTATLHHDFNNTSAETSGVIRDRRTKAASIEPDWYWEPPPGDKGFSDAVTLRWHGVHLLDSASRDPESDLRISTAVIPFSRVNILVGVGVTGLVILIMSAMVWTLARKVFLFQIVPLRITGERQAEEAVRDGRNVVLLLPSVSEWQLDEPRYTLNLPALMTRPNWAEEVDFTALPYRTPIELDHFEFTTGDADIDQQKTILLDRLLRRRDTQVAVMMTVSVSAEDYRLRFPEMEVIDLREEPFYWLAQYEGPARDLIWKECGPLPALWPLGAQLAKDLRHSDANSAEAVASEVLERADSYYRLIWAECTSDQKFVLAQFAEDGLLNPTNLRSIRQLVRRGLITTTPQFRLMNESFRRFLHSVASAELKKEWRSESRRTGWGKMHGAFFTTMVLLGLFLLTTQNALWQSSAAYVTTLLGVLGTASKLFTTFRTGTVAEKAD